MRFRPEQMVAPHLHMADLACKCGRPDCTHKDLDDIVHERSLLFFRRVGQLIGEYDRHVRVSSALRCPIHNASPKVKGSPNSAHIYMVAADLVPDGTPYELYLLAEAMATFSGLILYPHWGIHVDWHPDDRVTRGYSYGNGKYHTVPFGNRVGLPLERVIEWNSDYRIDMPDYVREAQARETTR